VALDDDLFLEDEESCPDCGLFTCICDLYPDEVDPYWSDETDFDEYGEEAW
jgi:hypothetical protein